MKPEEDIFLSILRAVLWGTDGEIKNEESRMKNCTCGNVRAADSIDWGKVLGLANRQSCLHAFGVWLLQQHIDTPYTPTLRVNTFATLQRQVRLNRLAAEVITLLQNHGIKAVLMKGYGLSLLYPDPDMRSFGDVDIYVGEKNYLQAARIVTDAFPDNYWHSALHGGIHYIMCLDEKCDRTLELHRVTMEFADKAGNQAFQAYTEHAMEEPLPIVSVGGTDVSVPRAAYNALYVFMHAWHHFGSTGVGFRQLGDWVLAVHHAYQTATPQEWAEATQEMQTVLDALHMTTVWQTFGHVLIDILGLPREEFPLYTEQYQQRAQRLTRQLLRDGHGYRPAHQHLPDMALMRRFPWQRPEKGRVLQKMSTACRLFFNAWQMGKFFPRYAWHELCATIKKGLPHPSSKSGNISR